MKNNGDGTFTQITNINIVTDSSATLGHSWADYNNDGNLDLFLCNGGGVNMRKNKLFLSNGNGDYIPVTSGDIVNDYARSQSAAWGDYDNDGYMDLFVSAPFTQNLLYHNNKDGTFTRVLNDVMGTSYSRTWSSQWVDMDNDGNLDFFQHNSFWRLNYVFHNNGNGTFTSITNNALCFATLHNNGGSSWGDYDNDGDMDVFISSFYGNKLYSNDGAGNFTEVTNEIVSHDIIVESYGATWIDHDNDGDLDLFVTNAFGAPESFLYNNNGNNNTWLDVKCIGTISNTSAIGARVYVKANINGADVWQMREINANGKGVNPLNQHFGFGNSTIIDSLKIYWPVSHITQIFTNIQPNRFIEIKENENLITEAKKCKADYLPKNAGTVSGTIYNDDNNNCIFDNIGSDVPLANRMIQVLQGPYFVFSNNFGNYTFRLPKNSYDISQVVIPNDIWELQNCQQPSYSLNVLNNTKYPDNNFAVKPSPLANNCDVEIILSSIPSIFPGPCTVSPGFQNLTSPCFGYKWRYSVTVLNMGNNAIPAQSTLVVTIDPSMTYVSTFDDGCNFNLIDNTGNVITWELASADELGNGESCTITFDVMVNSLAYSFSTSALFTAKCGDIATYTDDIDSYCSCDPNNKLVSPVGCGVMKIIGMNDNLTYQINFQNIGSGPAHDIIIQDQLDSNLDLTTLLIISVSHNLSGLEIIPDNKLIFEFDSIMLPDSASNPLGSNGYVVFSIKPKSNLAEGIQIANQAGIYFDYNEVVMTNTTLNTLSVHPYPTADFTYFHSSINTGNVYDFTYVGNYTGTEQFIWDFGSTAFPGSSTDINPHDILFSQPGNYNITLIVDKQGCISRITKSITIVDVSCGNNKTLVCHNGHIICISNNAIPAHLSHGDYIGPCLDANINARLLNNDPPDDLNAYYDSNDGSVQLEQINKGNYIIDIYNQIGQKIQSLTFTAHNEKVGIKIDNIPAGIYFGAIKKDDKFIYSVKIIKL